MDAKLCATVSGLTTEELRQRRDAATRADMVELRVDCARDLDLAGVLSGRECPVIVTCRPVWEGGQFRGSEEERARILQRAHQLGADFVDVEWRGPYADLVAAERGRRIVLSSHDFEGMPADVEDRYRAMRGTGAHVVKVAVTPRGLADLVRLRAISGGVGDRTSTSDEARVLIGMGPTGLASRLVPDWFGSAWTYGGAPDVGPGQMTIDRMLDEYQIRRARAMSEIYGVVGRPIAHSLSPAMHNAGFAETGRDAVYVPLQASDARDFWTFADAVGLRGASVTAPFKEAVVPALVDLDPLGRRIGAVNTVRRTARGWEGLNTDAPGFLAPLRSLLTLEGARASVLGAGGAARGVAVALADSGARVSIHARRADRARTVAALVEGGVGPWPPVPGSWDLLVNTTPLGTAPRVEESPLPDGEFGEGVVYDLVYNPRMTRLCRDAAAAGCPTIGGLEMLVAQAELQFAWWTGVRPLPGLFRQAAERALDSVEGGVGDRDRA